MPNLQIEIRLEESKVDMETFAAATASARIASQALAEHALVAEAKAVWRPDLEDGWSMILHRRPQPLELELLSWIWACVDFDALKEAMAESGLEESDAVARRFLHDTLGSLDSVAEIHIPLAADLYESLLFPPPTDAHDADAGADQGAPSLVQYQATLRRLREATSQSAGCTPDFTPCVRDACDWTLDVSILQRNLLSAPWGLGVVDVAGWPALGDRTDVRVGVLDRNWHREHPELTHLLPIDVTPPSSADPHGDATIGLLFSADDGQGYVGFVPRAKLVFADLWGISTPVPAVTGILLTLRELRAGDVLLVEQNTPLGEPISYYRSAETAIKIAIEQGVHVIEPAGNGPCDLDDPSYGGHFDRGRDSGSTIVAAVCEASPAGRYRRRREESSSFGSRVDAHAFGSGLATLLGNDFSLGNHNNQYGFTSAASCLVAGCAAVAAVVVRRLSTHPVPPSVFRVAMTDTGHRCSASEHSERVGVQPDMNAFITRLRRYLYEVEQLEPKLQCKVPSKLPAIADYERAAIAVLANGGDAKILARWLEVEPALAEGACESVRRKLGVDAPLHVAWMAERLGLL